MTRSGEEEVEQRARALLEDERWKVYPSLTEAHRFAYTLYVSGYWIRLNGGASGDNSTTYTPPYHPNFLSCSSNTHNETTKGKNSTLSAYNRLLRSLDDETLRAFMKYVSVQMHKSGLVPSESLPVSSDFILGSRSAQAAFLLCMQHYLI